MMYYFVNFDFIYSMDSLILNDVFHKFLIFFILFNRKKYINKINDLRQKFPEDTIIVKEQYLVSCSGCPADFVEFFSKETYFSLTIRKENNEPAYKGID